MTPAEHRKATAAVVAIISSEIKTIKNVLKTQNVRGNFRLFFSLQKIATL